MLKKNYSNSKTDSVFNIAVFTILIGSGILVVYPIFFMVIASISDPVLVNSGQVWLIPKDISIKGYEYVFRDTRILTGYFNTIVYSLGFMILSIAFTMMGAYPMSNRTLVGRRFFNLIIIIPMYFGGGLIPTYITIMNIGLRGKPVLLCILGALSAFYIIITRTYFETNIPNEIEESASIDGCNQAHIFFKIILPLSKPIIAVIGLYSFVCQWNSYFNAMIYLNDSKYFPLQLVLRDILILNQNLKDTSRAVSIEGMRELAEQQKIAEMIKYCVIIVSAGPLLIAFPFFQKYFAQGIMIGAIKG